MEHRFKVGDLVRCKTEHEYSITNKEALCKIVGYHDEDESDEYIPMDVEIIEHKGSPSHIGSTHYVNELYFELECKKRKIKKGSFQETFIKNKRKSIIKEIQDNPEFSKCFKDVKKEVGDWDDTKILNYPLD